MMVVTFLYFLPLLLHCSLFWLHIKRSLKNMCGLERIFRQLQSGINYNFLARDVWKWWLKEGNRCCDIFFILNFFAMDFVFQSLICFCWDKGTWKTISISPNDLIANISRTTTVTINERQFMYSTGRKIKMIVCSVSWGVYTVRANITEKNHRKSRSEANGYNKSVCPGNFSSWSKKAALHFAS